jgi:TP901-1 family phage major tail protein
MSGPVAGIDFLVKVENKDTPGTFDTLGGQQDASMSLKTGESTVQTKDIGNWEKKLKGNKGWSISADAAWVESDVAYKELEAKWFAGEEVKVQVLTQAGNTYTGSAIIAVIDYDMPTEGAATMSISLSGNGALDKVTV